ncbi:MAG: hypothetical protein HYS80_00605 [Candidatus Aenigmarchaeota archaeon]|nr:hypothetical protein [Candidatus Aenigmarchaeota archaeon]
MVFQFEVANLVNLFAFLGLTTATYTIFYFGKMMNPTKDVSFNLFTLALGVNLIGLSHLFRVWLDPSTSPLIIITVSTGVVFLSIGTVWVFYEKGMEMSKLRKREEEIKSIIAKLKDKYYQQELSEKNLEGAYSALLKELAEIEVRLTRGRK